MILAALLLAQIPQTIKYATYANDRFQFTVSYPTFLKAERAPDNGDGQAWSSKSTGVKMIVWAGYNAADSTLKAEYEAELSEAKTKGGTSVYKVLKPGFFAVSYLAGGHIFYSKRWLKKETFYGIRFEYPSKLKSKMDKVVSKSVASFRLP